MATNDNNKVELVEYEARQYQIDLYKAAKDQNIIACLGTGTGKTFISILLMSDSKYLPQLNGSYKSGTAKRTFFLVPTRPLVHQQRGAIVSAPQTSDLKVGAFTGDMNVDFWDKVKWDNELEKFQVIVMTPQILLDMLNHKYITFDKINLVVVDEVHWAARKKNKKESGHPYKQIMKLYNELDESRRPRVLGLSATPINCSMKVDAFAEAIADIEKTYSAVCMTGNVGKYGTNPDERIWCFANCDAVLSPTGGAVVKSLEAFLEAVKFSLKAFKDQRKCPTILTRMKKVLSTIKNLLIDPDMNQRVIKDEQTGETYPLFMTWMGVWCSSMAVGFYIKEIDEYRKVYMDVDPLYANLWGFTIKYLQQIQNTFATELNADPMSALKTSSPKMRRLLDIIREYNPVFGHELCGIIFVNQRCVAKVLCDWLMELKRLQPETYGFLKVGWVVGHSARPGIEVKIAYNSDSVQRKVIEKFRENEFNLLVATSVLEEGLDVRTCNLVVRFDRLNTFREYLQSKGRARAESARFYMVTANEDTHKLETQLKAFREMEEMVKNLNSKEKTEALLYADDESEDPDLYYRNETTGAIITARSAISLLYKYCQRLPSDSFTVLEPIFSIEEKVFVKQVFRGIVVLPVNCPIGKRSIEGPFKPLRETAKKAVAIRACKLLHESGELDDHLLPVNKETIIRDYVEKLGLRIKTLEINQEQKMCPTKQKVGTRNRKDIISKEVAQVFTNNKQHINNDHYLYGISLQFPKTDSLPLNCRTFGVITGQPIVKRSLISVYLKTIWNEVVDTPESSEVKVEFFFIQKMSPNVEQKESIEKFHCFIIEEIMRFSVEDLVFDTNNTEFKLLFVPLMSGTSIDWTFIDKLNSLGDIENKKLSPLQRERYQFHHQSFDDCIFYPWYKDKDLRGRHIVYYAKRVTDLTAKSQWITSNNNRKFDSFDEYYSKNWKIDIKNKNLPLIEGRALNKSAKGLFKGAQLKHYSTGKKDKPYTEYYPPELIHVHPFPASLWRQALCLPAVLFRLNHLNLGEQLRRTIYSETKPRIGSLNVDILELTSNLKTEWFNSSKTNHSKRICDSLDSDDECEGHDITDDREEVRDIPPLKKQRKINAIKIEKTTTERVVTVPKVIDSALNIANSMSGSTASSDLMKYTRAIIANFNDLVKNYITNKDDMRIQQLTMEKILQELNSVSTAKFPDLRYGEAFPFVFKGDISQYIHHKYDAKVNDPIKAPTAEHLLEALTMVGANDSFNLERLEVIGDSFLKLVSSLYVYFSCQELDEGRLSYLRQLQICNCNLYFIGREKKIDKLLVSHKWFPNDNWLLPSYHISDEKDFKVMERDLSKRNDTNKRSDSYKHRIVNNKSVADSVEALIGAHLMIGGNKTALIFMEWLGLKVVPLGAPPIDYLNSKNLRSDERFQWLPLPKQPINQALNLSPIEIDDFIHRHFRAANLEVFEQIIEYKFINKAYLIQALTHSSFHFNEYTDCYQKLEFLGDAIIDYLISRHIFATPNKKFNPGQLTDLRTALVNNAFFGAIAVKYKFHKFLKNLSPDLFRAIHNFEQKFNGGEIDSIFKSFDKLTEDECDDVEEVEVPKTLGDIFESVAGAIFLDSGLSLDAVWKVYYKLLKPEIDYFTEHIPQMPVKLIWEVCPDGTVLFGESEKIGRKTRVVLTAQGKKYGGVGKNRKSAKIAAAKNALKELKPLERQ